MQEKHIWTDDVGERNFRHQFSLNVRAEIRNGRFIVFHIMPPRPNGEAYLNVLNNVLFQLLEDLPLEIVANV
jgi:hypothetical protein